MTSVFSDHRSGRVTAARRALIDRRARGAAGGQPQVIPRRPASEPVPLSPVQHGLWVLDQLLDDNAVFGAHRTYWLYGPTDAGVLRRALDALVYRHEVLRTTYGTGTHGPVQHVQPPAPAHFVVTDVSDRPLGQARADAVRLARDESRTPFDLAGGPLFRALLVRVRPNEHLFVVNAHHTVNDEWSDGVVAADLSALYRAAQGGGPDGLPSLEVQYADYARWQFDRLSGGLGERQLTWWREAFDGVPHALRLPTDRFRPAVRTMQSGTVRHTLSPRASAALRDLAATTGSTLFTTLLAHFAVVLARWTGQEHFAVGTVVSGRGPAEVEPLLGLFANTVAVPMDLSGDPNVPEVVDRTRRTMLGVLDHQDVTFEQVVNVLNVPREAARHPLYQVDFQWVEMQELWSLPAVSVVDAELDSGLVAVDLHLVAYDRPGCLRLELVYAEDVFEPASAERLLRGVEQVALHAAVDAECPIGALTLGPLTPARPDGAATHDGLTESDGVTESDGATVSDAATVSDGVAPGGYLAPQSPTEALLCRIWSDVLGAPRVSVTDNFFDLGGNSLMLVKLVAAARAHRISVTPRVILRNQTVAKLASYVDSSAASATAADDQAASDDPRRFPLARLDQDRFGRLWETIDPASVEDVYVLTPLQSGMLFHAVAGGPDPYFRQFAYEIDEEVDADALARAWQHVVGQHAALRTAFRWEGLPHPVQVVLREVVVDLDRRDALAVAADDRAAWLDDLMATERDRGISLTDGPALRVLLVRTGERSHRLVVNTHHILLDGWSQSLVVQEVFAAYRAYAAGSPPPASASVAPFRDYVRWLASRDETADAAHWRDELRDFETPTPLPGARRGGGRAPDDRARVDVVAAVVADGLPADVRAAARRHRVTPGTVLRAAWALLLGRYSGEPDVVFGTTVLSRSADVPGIEDMVGMLMNTLPTREAVPPRAEVGKWLRAMHERQLDRYEVEHCSLSDIQRWAAFPGDRRLFESIFVATESAGADLAAATGVTVHDVTDATTDAGGTGYPLVAVVDLGKTELRLAVKYWPEWFAADMPHRLLAHYSQLLREIATAEPARLVSALRMLSDDELGSLLNGWNDTATPYPADRCLHELFTDQVRSVPDAVAVVEAGGTTVTYADLNRRANRIAHRLRRLGVGPEQLVGICLEHCTDMVAALLGILKAGGAYVPLDPSHPAERLRYILTQSEVRVLVTEPRLRTRVPAGAYSRDAHPAVVLLGPALAELDGEPDTDPPQRGGPANLAYVIYTSGSTGRPKGVMVPHVGLVNHLWWARAGLGMDLGTGSPMLGSIAFDLPITNLFLPLITGRAVTLLQPDPSLEPLAELLRRPGDFSMLKCTPGHLDVLQRMFEPGSVRSVRTFVVAGEALQPETVEAWRRIAPDAGIINEYGPTETVLGCTIHPVPEQVDPGQPVAIGLPLANTQVYLLDNRLEPVPVGAIGEVYIGGDGVTRGYVNRPGLTAGRFVPDPYHGSPGARMYRAGDLARRRADGVIEFLGRIDHQVKIRGYRVELGEIEATLLRHPALVEAVVVAGDRPDGQRRLVGYVVGRRGAPPAPAELREFLLRELPDYMVPEAFVPLDALPRGSSGKLDRDGLPAPDAGSRAVDADAVAPRTPTERRLAAVWTEVLNLDTVGVHDNFFALGGDSIGSIRIVSRAREEGLSIWPRQVFEHPTVAELARAADAVAQTPPARAAGPDAAGRFPLSGLSAAELDRLPVNLAEMDDVYQLSPLQKGMLLHSLVQPSQYNLQDAFTIEGELRLDVFLAAWQAVVDRHPTLRTSFAWEGLPHPVQIVHRTARVDHEVLDWRAAPETAVPERLRQLMLAEHHRPFELTRPSLLRLLVIRTDDQVCHAVWSSYHAILDGWSKGKVYSEVFDTYAALCAGRAPQPVASPPYREHIDWIYRQDPAADVAYWRQALAGFSTPPPLPGAHPPNDRTGLGDVYRVLPDDVAAAVQNLARVERVTVNAVLQAAWALLTSRYTARSDVLFGVQFSGRSTGLPGIEAMVGMLANTLPVGIRIDEAVAVGDWLRAVQAQQVEIRDREYSSLTDVARYSDLARGARLFDCIFLFENFFLQGAQTDGLTVTSIAARAGHGFPLMTDTGYPLVVEASLHEQMTVTVVYQNARYEPATVVRMLDDYERLLRSMATGAARPIHELDVRRPDQLAAPPAGTAVTDDVGARSGPDEPAETEEPAFVEPETATERALAAIWTGMLGVERVAVNDDFFELGGDSILAIHLVSRAREAGLDLSTRQVLSHPTIAGQASIVDGSDSGPAAVVAEQGEIVGPVPATPIQHWFRDLVMDHNHFNQAVLLDCPAPLDRVALRTAVDSLVGHHDALRLRLRLSDGTAEIVADGPAADRLREVDLSTVEPAGRPAARLRAADELHTSLDIASGPLLRAALLRTDGGEPDQLLLTVHHLAVDTVSWGILLADLATAYEQAAHGEQVSLPRKTSSVRDWAVRLAGYAASADLVDELPYWQAPRAGAAIPVDHPAAVPVSTAEVAVELSAAQTNALLRELPAAHGTRIEDALLAGLAQTLVAWTGRSECTVDVEGHGREPLFDDIDLSRTVGWFTTYHPVTLHLPAPADPMASLLAVRGQLFAVPRDGIGYGVARYLRGRGEVESAHPQVSFNYFGQLDRQLASTGPFRPHDEAIGAQRDPHGVRPHLIDVNAEISGGRLVVWWRYAPEVHERATVRRLAESYLENLRALAGGPRRPGVPSASHLAAGSHALVLPMARHRIPGASIAVIEDGRVCDAWGHGLRDTARRLPMTPQTAFRSGSASKHVAALIVMRLVQEGLIDLDADVTGCLRSWRLPTLRDGGPVTVRQLLGHTAGLTKTSYPGYPPGRPVPTLLDVLSGGPGASSPPVRGEVAPGTAYRYSGSHYAVLQQALVDLTETPYADLAQRLVFDPLGLSDTGYGSRFTAGRELLAIGHDTAGAPTDGHERIGPELAAAGMWTTAVDLATIEVELQNALAGRPTAFLAADSARQMVRPWRDSKHGLGTFVQGEGASRWFGHDGNFPGYRVMSCVFGSYDFGVVIMTNSDAGDALIVEILDQVSPRPQRGSAGGRDV